MKKIYSVFSVLKVSFETWGSFAQSKKDQVLSNFWLFTTSFNSLFKKESPYEFILDVGASRWESWGVVFFPGWKTLSAESPTLLTYFHQDSGMNNTKSRLQMYFSDRDNWITPLLISLWEPVATYPFLVKLTKWLLFATANMQKLKWKVEERHIRLISVCVSIFGFF